MRQNLNKKVIVFGTFDILHPGHLFFLNEAKRRGKELVVVVARDERVKKEKNKKPVLNEKDRLKMVQSLKMVDRAILGDRVGKCRVVFKIKPDAICVGYDQNTRHPHFMHQIRKIEKKPRIFKIKSYHPEEYKSSKIRT